MWFGKFSCKLIKFVLSYQKGEREVENIAEERWQWKVEEVTNTLLRGGRKSHVLLESSQASPARLTDKSKVKGETLELLEAMAWDGGRRIFIF
jgi:hypothetical protein